MQTQTRYLRPRTGGQRGRKPKDPNGRVSVRLELPKQLAEVVYREVRDDEDPLTDLGAYYLLLGWNAAHPEEQVEMPVYLAPLGRMPTTPSPQPSLLSA